MLPIDQSINFAFTGINSPFLNAAFGFASWLFNPLPFCILLLLSLWFLWKWSPRYMRKVNTVLLLGAPLIAFVITLVLKFIVNVPRPLDAQFAVFGPSFPSAHTAVATAYFLILLHFAKRAHDPYRRAVHYAFCILCPVMVGVSRLYFEVHWFSDVIVGYAVGALSVYAIIKIYGKPKQQSESAKSK